MLEVVVVVCKGKLCSGAAAVMKIAEGLCSFGLEGGNMDLIRWSC